MRKEKGGKRGRKKMDERDEREKESQVEERGGGDSGRSSYWGSCGRRRREV